MKRAPVSRSNSEPVEHATSGPVPPYARPIAEQAGDLRSDPERGLSRETAAQRLVEVGPNRLPSAERPAYATIAFRQLADPLVALLVVAAAVSLAIGEQLEAAAIAAIVVLNAVLGFFQEAGAERAVLALRSGTRRTAAVIRDGQEHDVPAEELVPGDVIVLREGDRVAADARLVVGEGLELDESALTGESVSVEKAVAVVALGTPLAERTSMVFAGTGVTRGRGRALVTATGSATELGAIADLTAEAKPPPTPLQRRLGRLSSAMVALGLGITVLLTLGMLARDSTLEEAFLIGVSVAVAAVPEGLAATVTIALAQGARAMAASGAIVRRLAAVETIGEATVIAADKTGTLTVNQLRVAEVRAFQGKGDREVLEVGVLASTAELLGADGRLRIAGDPVDGAFLLAAAAAGVPDARASGDRRLVLELPFDPLRKRQAAVYEENCRLRVVVKGAPETLTERSRLGPEERRRVVAEAMAWATSGLRVLAVGERWLDGPLEDEHELDSGIELIGLVGLHDPLRDTAADSVRQARAAGVKVAILTGDHPATAAAIARELGLGHGEPLTGVELEDMDEEALRAAASRHDVFARVTPADKLRLVTALQDSGHVVSVTGDGINDTPALRRADVGVAMGRSGTEAAREAAEIVLTDDDFATIVRAIREGRRIEDNVRKFVAFLLSANLGEVILFAVAVLAGLGAPMTVVQVLAVNLLTDGLPAIALSRDPAAAGTMRVRPRRSGALFSPQQRLALALAGMAVGLAAIGAYVAGRELAPEAAQTMAFATIALAELVFVFSVRSTVAPAWRGPRNATLTWSVLASALLVALVIYMPALHEPFGTQPLGPIELLVVAVLALVPTALVESVKARRRWDRPEP
ncbi:MAG TPA: cation-transporting P-type ATPase [Gaiellaceae bacterium]|nr:cation-transporting P-type ATPase [Gaiellaceae bacterium]